jgi:serine/threonine-protein kinase
MPLILSGRYLPIKLLGRGGFGAAFLARDRYTPKMRQCVVKQFQPAGDLTATQLATAQKLFEREAEVLEELGSQHDQIPDLFAFFEVTVPSLQPGQQDKFFYLVQEFIDGQNLEEELAQKGNFSEDEALELLQKILPVLQFVHENGTIHRDIKPSNIMRRRDGKLFLLDFGAVKQVANVGSGAAAGHSTGIYSMGFAPPEQMSGGQVFPATDLYALAVTALILLTAKDPGELFDAYNNRWSWRSHAPGVSPQLADVLDKMLLSAPNQRYQSATEVLEALSEATKPKVIRVPAKPPQPKPAPPPAPVTTQHQQPQPVVQPPPPPIVKPQPAFSTLELLGGAAFSGFEGGLIAIALYSLLKSPMITLGVSGVILTLLIFAQNRRWIEKFDLPIIAVITLAIVFFFLRADIMPAIVLAVAAGLVTVALTALFRLIYKLLSLLLG